MSILLYLIGAFAIMAGAAMIAYGVPINEFSFGNTLIVSGVTAATGGLIIVGLAAVRAQLHRMTEALVARPPAKPARAAEAVDLATEAPAPPARAKSLPRQRSETPAVREPFETRFAPPGETSEQPPLQSFTPTRRNPEAPPLTFEEDVLLSPRHPAPGPQPDFGPPERPAPPGGNGRADEQAHDPTFEPPWRQAREVSPSNFDSMWPAESKTRGPSGSPPPQRPERQAAAPPKAAEPSAAKPPRNVAILKSGVVDGMAYTLYVDGSIEAELPQGTLRFASIEELRNHIEKNS
jgi:hypothetical protein